MVAVAVSFAEDTGATTGGGPMRYFRDGTSVPLPADGHPIVHVIQPGPVAVTCDLDGHLAEETDLVPVDEDRTVWARRCSWGSWAR